MSISKRQQEILDLLNLRTYLSVNALAERLFTSPSSIRRDLTRLQSRGLVVRIHGGVTLPNLLGGVASYDDRLTQNTHAKRIIAKKAAALLSEGQTVMLDCSSTSAFLLPYIAKLDKVSLFTNNIATAKDAIDLGIKTYCIGGTSVGGTYSLTGTEAYRVLSTLSVDIAFFSSQSLDKNGDITDPTEEENYSRILMLTAAKKKVFLCDSSKFGKRSLFYLGNARDMDLVICDKEYEELPPEVKQI